MPAKKLRLTLKKWFQMLGVKLTEFDFFWGGLVPEEGFEPTLELPRTGF